MTTSIFAFFVDLQSRSVSTPGISTALAFHRRGVGEAEANIGCPGSQHSPKATMVAPLSAASAIKQQAFSVDASRSK